MSSPFPPNHALLLAIAALAAPIAAVGADAPAARVHPPAMAATATEPLGPPPALRRFSQAPSAGVARVASEGLAEAVDRCVAAGLAATGVPGAAVAVVVDGQLAYTHGYGVKHRRDGGEITAGTTFRIGSITKMMTAAAVLQQVEAGHVALDDRVTRLIPEFEVAGFRGADLVTVRHLLAHTSAIPDLPFELDGPRDDSAIADWVRDTTSMRLHAQPGAFYNYSNPNYALAGLTAERASGIPYHRLVTEAVWQPAGMSDTTFDPDVVMARGDYSFGHFHNAIGREQIVAPNGYDNWAIAPAGYAFSTAADLARWVILLMAGGAPVLEPASAAAMQAPQAFMNYAPDQFYGFGIAVSSYKGLGVREHDGYLPGWGSELLWVPSHHFAVAVLGNGETPLYQAAYCIVNAVLAPEDVPPPDLTTDPSTWAPYEGGYAMSTSLGEPFRADVSLRGDDLILTLSDEESDPVEFAMHQFAGDAFAIDSDGDGILDLDLTFIHGPSAAARWLRNRSYVGERATSPRGRMP